MERARISSNDMMQAVAFIDAALKLEEGGADSKTDVTHLALVVAAVIYYARPFGPNEGGKKRKRKTPPKGEPPARGRAGLYSSSHCSALHGRDAPIGDRLTVMPLVRIVRRQVMAYCGAMREPIDWLISALCDCARDPVRRPRRSYAARRHRSARRCRRGQALQPMHRL